MQGNNNSIFLQNGSKFTSLLGVPGIDILPLDHQPREVKMSVCNPHIAEVQATVVKLRGQHD